MSFVQYGAETRSLTLRKECRLRVLENRILKRIFGLKRDENSAELFAVRVKKSSRLRWLGHVVRMGKGRKSC